MFSVIALLCLLISGLHALKTRPSRFSFRSTTTALGYRTRKQSPDEERKSVENIVRAFKLFKSIYGNLNIPTNFRVPENDDWPKELHGLRLGSANRRIAYKGIYPDYHRLFEEVGLLLRKNDKNFENFVSALLTYKELYGTMRVRMGSLFLHRACPSDFSMLLSGTQVFRRSI
jgi:hypothetical protein